MINTIFLLLIGFTLSQNGDYVGSENVLSNLNPPEELLNKYHYYRLVNNFKLNRKQASLKQIEYLENIATGLPLRYESTIPLIKNEVLQWKNDFDDLCDISREMEKSMDRLKHARGGATTQKIQKDIVDRLDKIIDQLEQAKASKDKTQNKQQAKGNHVQEPANDSHIDNTGGKGMVTPAKIRKLSGSWGNANPKEREKSLQEITQNMPQRYQESIQNYFRNIANQRGKR